MNGPWTLPAAREALDAVRLQADRQGQKQVLLDLRGLSKPESDMVRAGSGQYLAQLFPPPFKVAAFASFDAINLFGQTAALSQGAEFRIFPEEHNAIEWLTEGSNKVEIKNHAK
jgi:hypothetical protein